MTVTEVLKDPMFSNSVIARKIWPEIKDQKSAGSRLSMKLNGLAGQRLTDNDKERIAELFKKVYNIELEPI